MWVGKIFRASINALNENMILLIQRIMIFFNQNYQFWP